MAFLHLQLLTRPQLEHRLSSVVCRWVWIIPAVVFIGLLVAGELGVWAAAKDFENQRRELAISQVTSSADQVRLRSMHMCGHV